MRTVNFNVVLESNPEGGFTARCVEIPGAISEGETEEEAMENVADAIQLILAARREEAERQARVTGSSLRRVAVDA